MNRSPQPTHTNARDMAARGGECSNQCGCALLGSNTPARLARVAGAPGSHLTGSDGALGVHGSSITHDTVTPVKPLDTV